MDLFNLIMSMAVSPINVNNEDHNLIKTLKEFNSKYPGLLCGDFPGFSRCQPNKQYVSLLYLNGLPAIYFEFTPNRGELARGVPLFEVQSVSPVFQNK